MTITRQTSIVPNLINTKANNGQHKPMDCTPSGITRNESVCKCPKPPVKQFDNKHDFVGFEGARKELDQIFGKLSEG